jgi:hypothetical protein
MLSRSDDLGNRGTAARKSKATDRFAGGPDDVPDDASCSVGQIASIATRLSRSQCHGELEPAWWRRSW